MTESPYGNTPLRSYGRIHGRKLKASQAGLMETLLPELLISPEQMEAWARGGGLHDGLAGEVSRSETGGSVPPKKIWFEIGFGGGEHLVEQARQNPQVNFIGCEPYANGMAALLALMDKLRPGNIRLYNGDARALLEALPDASLERVFILFPDPWPKARHHKRRIVSPETLALLFRKLIPGGLLRLATDHEDYGVWMFERLLAFGRFRWRAERCADWQNPPPDWVRTRYQAKAEALGRGAIFLDWEKPSQ